MARKVILSTHDPEDGSQRMEALKSALGEHFFESVGRMQKQMQDLAKTLTPAINISLHAVGKLHSSGVFDTIQKATESYAEMLKYTQPITIFPPELISGEEEIHVGEKVLSDDEVERIATRAAEKLFEMRAKENTNAIFLILNSLGDLYRKDNHSKCYPMKGEGKRIEIIKYLIGKAFTKSDIIMNDLNISKYKDLTDPIGKINAKAKHHLSLPDGFEHRLIISKKSYGYRINPNYPIEEI